MLDGVPELLGVLEGVGVLDGVPELLGVLEGVAELVVLGVGVLDGVFEGVLLGVAEFVVLGVGMYYHANLWPDHPTIWSGNWVNWRIWTIIYYPYWQLYGEINNEVLEGKSIQLLNAERIYQRFLF